MKKYFLVVNDKLICSPQDINPVDTGGSQIGNRGKTKVLSGDFLLLLELLILLILATNKLGRVFWSEGFLLQAGWLLGEDSLGRCLLSVLELVVPASLQSEHSENCPLPYLGSGRSCLL